MWLFCVLPNTPIIQSLAVLLLKLVHTCVCLQSDFKSNCPQAKAAGGLAVCLKAVDFCCWDPTYILHQKQNISFADTETVAGLARCRKERQGYDNAARLAWGWAWLVVLALTVEALNLVAEPILVREELAGVLHQLRSLWHAEGWSGKCQCYSNPSQVLGGSSQFRLECRPTKAPCL